MSEITNELIADAGERMKKSVESTRHEFGTVRTGRASAGLLDRIVVDYYGSATSWIWIADCTRVCTSCFSSASWSCRALSTVASMPM